jgi:hypothetical protein
MSNLLSRTLLSAAVILALPLGTFSVAYSAEKAQDKAMNAQNETLNEPYNAFLGKYVRAENGLNLVAYGEVSDADEAKLEAYIQTLSELDISAYSDEEIMAYWFNLYNAKTIDVILDNYPLKSIRKIGFRGPWKKKVLTVRGKKMSLDNIEHDTIRATYDEPRIHFAFNCASIGCPNLKPTAWEAETLEADLDQAARDYIQSPRGVVFKSDGDLIGSSLFDWYKDDFGDSTAEVAQYLSQFADGETKTALEKAAKFDDYIYDWDLNDAK